MSHNRSGEIANIDDLDPGQEYYIIGAHWGAALPASKVGDRVDMAMGNSGAWNPGQSGGEKWTIQRAGGGYNIKSVEHGAYLGFHHAEIGSAGLTGDRNASEGLTGARDASAGLTASKGQSAGLTASKEPFEWTVEPQDKGDGVFRFTVPHTEVHVDFSSVASVTSGASGITTETDQTTEADFAASDQTTESDFAASESDEAAFAREMAAAGHDFDPSFKAGGGGGDPSFASGSVRASDEATSADADSGYSADAELSAGGDLNAGGSVEANGGGSVEANGGGNVEANGGSTVEGAGPTLHAFGRPYGFPPGYFSK